MDRVAPITLDVTAKDAETDVIIRDKKEIGRPFAVTLVQAHMVSQYQLLSYVGRLSDRAMARVIRQMKTVLSDYCELSERKRETR